MHQAEICPFCSTVIQEHSFLESKNFRAIYNIAPILPGHSLVIPKSHITSFMELTENDLFEFVSFSRKAIQILSIAFKTSAFDWTLQEKEEAGQTIAHIHIHIVPRLPDDLPNPGDWYSKLKNNTDGVLDSDKRIKITKSEMQSIVENLKNIAFINFPD